MDAMVVREIVWLPELHPIEEMPEYTVGALNLRGQIVPVMDLVVRFGHPRRKYRLQDKVIILESGDSVLGIVANEVHDVVVINRATVRHAAAKKQFAMGEIMVEENIIMLLNHLAICDFDFDNTATHLLPEVPTDEQAKPAAQWEAYFCPEADEKERDAFHQRARELMQSVDDKAETDRKLIAVVELGRELYGVDLDMVREFSNIDRIAPVPCTPAHIIGNINLRGEILTLLDIREALGLKSATRTDLRKTIIIETDWLTVGVPVEKIDALVYLQAEEILPSPTVADGSHEEHLSGTAKYGERLLGILDMEKILQSETLIVNEDV